MCAAATGRGGAAFHRGDADAEDAAVQPSGDHECLPDLWSSGEAGQRPLRSLAGIHALSAGLHTVSRAFVVGASVIAVAEWLALSQESFARAFSILGKRQISCPSGDNCHPVDLAEALFYLLWVC